MKYIIDANNLAGKLKSLGYRDFDKKLIEMIKDFTKGKKNEIVMVFDPKDEWGDKNTASDTLTVYYTPRDAHYESADDKIVEIINQHLTSNKEELTIITDDVGLRKRVEQLMEETKININFIRATEYADRMLRNKADDKADNKEELDNDKKDRINKELLDIWQ